MTICNGLNRDNIGIFLMKVITYSCFKLFFIFLLLCNLLSTPSLTNASQEKQATQKVLIVNSYHPGYAWSDDIMLGIRDVLGTQKNVELIIEYLDTKRQFGKSYFQQMKELFRQKYKTTDINLIITSDDNALDFILSIRKELFPDVPLIFCGIDHIEPERIANQENVYGIEEADSTSSTIDLILSIHPDIESITFIADETPTGKLMIDQVRQIESTHKNKIHFEYLIGMSIEELQSTIKNIPDNTVIFYLSFIRDKNGKVFSIIDSMQLIADGTSVPVYCSWGFQPETGVLGGNVLSGYKQGEISAKVAGKLLDGNSVERIPIKQQAPLVYKFDYHAMNRFNIDEGILPQNSVIYNRPSSLYSKHKKLIWSTLFVIFFLLAFITLLFLNIKQRRKAESELRKAHGNLDQKVKIRTDELINANELLMREIEDRKQAEEALGKSQNRFREIFKQSPFGIALIGSQTGHIYELNPKFAEIAGRTIEEMKGIDWMSITHPDDVQEDLDNMALLNAGKTKGLNMDKRYIRPDGSHVWVNMTIAPVTADDKTHPRHLCMIEDIAAQKKAAEERKQLQDKLQRAQKMEAMGLMAGGVAHDLNNILSGIVSYPELLLLDLPEDSPLRRPIKTIQESGMRAADVVEDLLTIARGIASGKEVLNLNTLITEYLGSAEHQKLQKIHLLSTFKAELDPELLNITGSPSHVKKIMMNMVTNASEAIDGKGTVTVSTVNRYLDDPLKGYEDVRAGEYVMLTVSDDGSGIAPTDLERIFEPFYTKKVMGRSGTGLGLAVVWNSMQDHDGYINVKSSERGTAFELYFPVTREDVADKKDEVPLENYKGHGEKVLVVDDEERQREIAIGILTRLGYVAEAVSSGEEAIEYVKEHPVVLVVLDMVMPKGINGRKTYEEIIKIRPGQKAIIASGYAKTREVDAALKLGAGEYIKKPYTLAKVGLAVKEELEK